MGRLSPLLQWAFLRLLNTAMEYRLYTTVDITHTGQYRATTDNDAERWKEQNFQTVLQTLGIRANVSFSANPKLISIAGNIFGFNTSKIIHVWQFDFNTEQAGFYDLAGDPIGYLIEDFDAVPYIAGLDESMEQNYAVFVTSGPARNIIFKLRE
jgi:hypothetical protein